MCSATLRWGIIPLGHASHLLTGIGILLRMEATGAIDIGRAIVSGGGLPILRDRSGAAPGAGIAAPVSTARTTLPAGELRAWPTTPAQHQEHNRTSNQREHEQDCDDEHDDEATATAAGGRAAQRPAGIGSR